MPAVRLPRLTVFVRCAGIALFAWIITRMDLRALFAEIAASDARILLLSLVVVFAIYAVKTARWVVLVRSTGTETSFAASWRIYNTGIFLGNITPGKLGEFSRGLALTRAGMHPGTAAMLTVLDRALDILLVAVLAVGGVFVLFGERWFLASLLAVGGVAAITIAFWKKSHPLREQKEWLRFLSILARPRVACALILQTVIGWMLYYLWAWLIAVALGIAVPTLPLLAASTITGILSLLPIAPAGLGTRDAALLVLLAPYGVSSEQSVAIAMLMFASILLSSVPGGWYWLISSSRSRSDSGATTRFRGAS